MSYLMKRAFSTMHPCMYVCTSILIMELYNSLQTPLLFSRNLLDPSCCESSVKSTGRRHPKEQLAASY